MHPFGWNLFTSRVGQTDKQTDTQTKCSENIIPPRFRGGVKNVHAKINDVFNCNICKNPSLLPVTYKLFSALIDLMVFLFISARIDSMIHSFCIVKIKKNAQINTIVKFKKNNFA